MEYLSLFGYILEICIFLVSILVVLHFYHKYSLKFYLTYAYCIMTGNLFVILAFLGHYLTVSILGNQPANISIKSKFSQIFNFMSMPFLILCLFFIMVLFRDIFLKPLTPVLKKISLVTGLIFAALGTYVYIDLFNHQNLSATGRTINIILETLVILVLILSIGQGFFYLKDINDFRHRRILKTFTLLFIIIFSIPAVNVKLFSGLLSDIAVLLPWELIVLIFMVRKMNEFYFLRSDLLEKSRILEKVYSRYGITRREREIIALICQGKTNRNIEDTLFISLQTVKNNIYNIFKKLNVKNRVELVNFIRFHTAVDEKGSDKIPGTSPPDLDKQPSTSNS